MYTYVLELRFILAAYWKSIPCLSNNISFLYDFVWQLYTLTPYIYIYIYLYKRLIPEQYEWDTFITLTVLG